MFADKRAVRLVPLKHNIFALIIGEMVGLSVGVGQDKIRCVFPCLNFGQADAAIGNKNSKRNQWGSDHTHYRICLLSYDSMQLLNSTLTFLTTIQYTLLAD